MASSGNMALAFVVAGEVWQLIWQLAQASRLDNASWFAIYRVCHGNLTVMGPLVELSGLRLDAALVICTGQSLCCLAKAACCAFSSFVGILFRAKWKQDV